MRRLLIFVLLAGCGGGDDAEAEAADAATAVEPDAAPPEATCDEGLGIAVLAGPFTCATEPEVVELSLQGRAFDMFKYEASHPLATSTLAFPCAASVGREFRAPAEETEPCSVAGVRPWHTVRWDQASEACTSMGWRLCTGPELLLACGGDRGTPYTWGTGFEPGKCNFREAFRAEGTEFASEAPTGGFEDCVSSVGVHDVNGNLWEWTADRNPADIRARTYQGAGWKTIAERHRDTDLYCDAVNNLPSFSAPTFSNQDVGFRCCRDR